MELIRATVRTFVAIAKGIYDIFATYLLFWVLYFAGVAVVLHVGASALEQMYLTESLDAFFARMAEKVPMGPSGVRIAAFGAAHLLILLLVFRPLSKVQSWVQDQLQKADAWYDEALSSRPVLHATGELLFSLFITVLFVPFVLQPTLVPEVTSVKGWKTRTVNLLDGTASAEIADSVVGFYRRWYAEPVVVEGVSEEEFAESEASEAEPDTPVDEDAAEPFEMTSMPRAAYEPAEWTDADEEAWTHGNAARRDYEPIEVLRDNGQPMMDRWDDYILEIAEGDAERFAMIKAFIYVESAGQQYAVSRTGCAGLMQFCSGTARSRPFKRVFGTGQVYTCDCDGRCNVPRETRRALESGDLSATLSHEKEFPCELTDARFDPNKIIEAGSLYIGRLYRSYGGNIYLMYIGYNSGPAVANRAWKALGENPDATIAEIGEHLTEAMKPYYDSGSAGRARALTRTHLPKVKRAYDRYAKQAGMEVASGPDVGPTLASSVSRTVPGASIPPRYREEPSQRRHPEPSRSRRSRSRP